MRSKIAQTLVLFSQRGPWPIILFILSHLTNIYSKNHPTVSIVDTARIFIIYGLLSVTLSGILFLLNKNWIKTNIILLIILGIEFYFSPLHTHLKSIIGKSFWTSYTFLIPLLIFVVIVSAINAIRKPSIRVLNLISVYSILVILISITGILIHAAEIPEHSSSPGFPELKIKPDIVLIVLDEYAGKESLSSYFNYDNSDFSKSMNEIGFQEVQNPKSLYNLTIYSIASLFNMRELDLYDDKSSNIKNRKLAIETINTNRFTEFLKTNKYKTHNSSIFPFNNQPPKADLFKLHIVGADYLTYYNTSTTIFRDLSYHIYTDGLFGQSLKSLQRKQIKHNLKVLKDPAGEIALDNTSPDFYYIHALMPHDPYLVKSNGEEMELDKMNDKYNKNSYISYLTYCNKIILDVLRNMIKKKEKTIFVVMSDHGWKNMITPTKEGFEFNSILYTKGLSKSFPDSTIIPNILPLLLDELYDSSFQKYRYKSKFLYD